MRCSLLGDKSFPVFSPNHAKTRLSLEGAEKPLPPRPTTWLESLPPLILSRSAENLRVLDLSFCPITDAAVGGVCAHAPRIQNLVLSGCMQLTDIALEHVCLLGSNLDVLQMDRCPNITDAGVIKLARASVNLRALDLSCECQKTLHLLPWLTLSKSVETWLTCRSTSFLG
jgi:F-box and leucine-rich repeat protein GRR1